MPRSRGFVRRKTMSDNENKNKNEKMSFESATKRLEEIVAQLEKGNASLEDSLRLYEEGVGLVRICNDALDNAEKRIKILVGDGSGEMTEKDYSENV